MTDVAKPFLPEGAVNVKIRPYSCVDASAW